MRTIRAFYRDYFIDLHQGDQKDWRVASIIHSHTGQELSPPLATGSDDVTAERHARAVVDEQLAADFRDAARQARLATPS